MTSSPPGPRLRVVRLEPVFEEEARRLFPTDAEYRLFDERVLSPASLLIAQDPEHAACEPIPDTMLRRVFINPTPLIASPMRVWFQIVSDELCSIWWLDFYDPFSEAEDET